MAYLEPSEYLAFGLQAETSDAWVNAASSMIDAHCRRRSLLPVSYTERLRVSRHTATAQLTYAPIVQVTAVQARYAPHGDVRDGMLVDWAVAFGLPGQWIALDASTLSVDNVTGEVRLPWNLLGLRYSEVEVSYTAGLAAIPDLVKFACAQIVKNAQATPGLNVRSSRMDTLQTQYFSDSLLDSQVQSMLRPFVAERLG